MSVSIFQIKRWVKMLSGKSPEHVTQNIGRCFSTNYIKGYYNDLSGKVDIEPFWLYTDNMLTVKQRDGARIVFPVAVFQYALGCFDLYLLTNEKKYWEKFLQYADWTLNNQDSLGRWSNFEHVYPHSPYGSMAQGEAVSVLIRAYEYTKDQRYIDSAKLGIDFMLKSVSDGGTSLYKENDLVFKEFTHLPVVLNGWIFSWWGLYDYVVATNDKGAYLRALTKSSETLIKYLPQFDCFFWSKYDLSSKLTSPFYHRLHIAQLKAMYALTGNPQFLHYAEKWEKQLKNPLYKSLAFFIKATQKILE